MAYVCVTCKEAQPRMTNAGIHAILRIAEIFAQRKRDRDDESEIISVVLPGKHIEMGA